MKNHLISTFRYNDWANTEVLKTILALPEKQEAVRLFSHLISSQNKWYNRIKQEVPDETITWFGSEFNEAELLPEWKTSVNKWIDLLENTNDSELGQPVKFKRQLDGKMVFLSLQDLALQLNYHSIHHRAQINTLISKQGLKPPPTDFIYTKMQDA